MLKPIHSAITRRALGGIISERGMDAIISANLNQDRLLALINHDEYHFDANAFEQSYAYLEEQRALTVSALEAGEAASAWAAFGRLTHGAQDFYAHSNYIDLWLARHANGSQPTPSEIDPLDRALLDAPDLHSCRMYLPLEILYFIRPFTPLALRLLPADSHAHMNLDSPDQGPRFEYAFHAAVKRTQIEFDRTASHLSPDSLQLLSDLNARAPNDDDKA